jgi:peptide/nickel transport system ATP-binding protein
LAIEDREKLFGASEPIAHLKNEYGISILYITHDLATAYQLSDFILVLHNGCVVEAGSPEEVIMNPMHPYTESLIEAVPTPDPYVRWPPFSPEAAERWGAKPVIRRGELSGFSFIPA